MAFNAAPVQAELFGRPRFWLRQTPTGGDSGWAPSLAGVYPNTVWARAAETMTRELLGSSDGQPGLTLAVARPPLLRDTLELRVREPLGEEERQALLGMDPDLVKHQVVDLPGDWVLWKQVPDPADCGPAARVYALDESTGTVSFGDGRHGAIPPAGADSIVAFAYQRTEPAVGGEVPGNFVLPRAELDLVTPVQSVETVIAADRSAGGVPPGRADRVVRFAPAMLRHRGRAVSLRDFEDLVRQNSAEVAQARCFARNGGVRLVVVMRGDTPWPSRAQQRELRRMLLEIASPALAAPGALVIAGPAARRLRIALTLRVATLDVAGTVAGLAKERLVARFDTERGGDDGEGWPMGRDPREEDIAGILLDLPDLESIVSIARLEVGELGGERPWRGGVGPQELAMLAPEDILIRFEVLEAVG
jgi:predicted phage baseplate assembly protein